MEKKNEKKNERKSETGSKKLESTRIFIRLAFSKTSSMTHKHVHCSIFHAKADTSDFGLARN
ncbi:hypothetical protein UNDKW_0277 [Undibacterium sp. KW1]|uniref:hypothetical protein n=1 Tax=Undibacterium sp. KW1 TaxID=2058624 RepID=UPI001331FB0B|nr:hypothetical protein [Undibacterium sp. KW1]BBB58550.1 hypothetical protein UNDKW_0277 [Undibacterium sp. KW1]